VRRVEGLQDFSTPLSDSQSYFASVSHTAENLPFSIPPILARGRLAAPQGHLKESKCRDCPLLTSQYQHVHRVRRLRDKQAQLQHALSNEALRLLPDFKDRLGAEVAMGVMEYVPSTYLWGACVVGAE
jgi:hypothetical protein